MAEGRDAEALLDQALSATIAILCSEAAAIAGRCLRETVSYTSMRTQFDRPVGSFQALKHRMADMWWRSIGAEAAAEAAITLASSGPLGPAETTRLLAAKVFTSEAAVNNAEEALQLHGGIGMTWEAGHHFYLKRAKADQVAFGATGRCLDAVADELGLTY
jgi:alkylation response protein AidB-like acyl-CoA dehydrogenase